MFLTNWLRPRTEKKSPQPRTRPSVLALEDRTTPSWLAQIGGTGDESHSADSTVDAAGNSYIGGQFVQIADFESSNGAGVQMTSAGLQDAFAAKYMADGQLAWARRFGGTEADDIRSVVVDSSAAFVYILGTYRGSADLTGDGVVDATAVGNRDVFVSQLDAATGATQWVRTFGSAGDEEAGDMTVTDSTVWLTGSFRGAIDFDPGPGTRTLVSTGKYSDLSSDAFVLGLNPAGNHVASFQIGGANHDKGFSLLADGDTIYVSGSFYGTADFDPGPGSTTRTNSGTSPNTFLARYSTASSTPTLNWVQTLTTNATPSDAGLAADATSIYLQGEFYYTTDFDPGSGTLLLSATNRGDVYAARYTKAAGSLVWAKQFGSPGSNNYTTGQMVVDEGTGSVYLGLNSFVDTAIEDGGEYPDGGYLMKVSTAAGSTLARWQIGQSDGSGSVRPIGVVGTTVYAVGRLTETTKFPTGDTRTSRGERDVYVMALDTAAPAPPPVVTVSAAFATEGNSGWGTLTFTAILSWVSDQPVTLSWSTANGTATAGSDYEAAQGTLTFLPGQTVATFSVRVFGDTLREGDETFFIDFTSLTEGINAPGRTTGTIFNDDGKGKR